MPISVRLMSAALAACAAQLCGCSNFSGCYTEVPSEAFDRKVMFHGMEYTVQPVVEYRGCDERFAYFEFGRFLWFPELIKTPKRDFNTPVFRFGQFPEVEGVYYKRPWDDSLFPGAPKSAEIPSALELRREQPATPGRLRLFNEHALRMTDEGRIELKPPQDSPAAPIDLELAGKRIRARTNENP